MKIHGLVAAKTNRLSQTDSNNKAVDNRLAKLNRLIAKQLDPRSTDGRFAMLTTRNNKHRVQFLVSPINPEMLDKIKNIYSEMRKHAGGGVAASSLYYGGGNTIA